MPETIDPTPSTAKQTAMQAAQSAGQVAESALNLAQAVDNDLGENIRPVLTQLRQDLTDTREELTAYQAAVSRRLDALNDSFTNLDIAVDLAPLLARLEAAERTLAKQQAEHERANPPAGGEGYATALQVRLDALERRMSTVGAINDAPAVGLVHAKVLELMRKVNAIGKDRYADTGTGGKFKFRGIDDAMDAVGHAMREVGLTMETRVQRAEHVQNPVTNTGERGTRTVVWTTATVVYQYIFLYPEDGSRHIFEMSGEGRDASDKATSKAGSMALKYGLFQVLMIPVTGLDDSDTESPQIQYEPTTARPDQPVSQPPAASDQASRQQRARDALKAMRAINQVHPSERHARLTAIMNQVEKEQLGNAEVDRATLRAHAAAILQTLAADPATTQDDPPWNE